MRPVHGLGEVPRLVEVRVAGLPPEQVGMGRKGEAARDAVLDAVPAAGRSLPACGRRSRNGRSRSSTSEVISLAALGVGARDEQGRHAHDVGGEPRGVEVADMRWVGISTLPPRWPHFFSDASWSSK